MREGLRFPSAAGTPVELRAEDLQGNPLWVGGVPVTFSQLCPPLAAKTADSSAVCEPDTLHPPPAGQEWIVYQSNDVTMGDGSYNMVLIATWGTGSCNLLGGEANAVWFTNNGDDLYGDTVNDVYGEGVFGGPVVPTLSQGVLTALAALLVIMGAVWIARTRRRFD